MDFVERPHENEKKRALAYIEKLLEEAKNSSEERTEDIKELEEIQRLLNTKKYGLVWEEHSEKFEEDLENNIPIYREDVSRKIYDDKKCEAFNFLLEGDNLHSLHLLEKTHSGKIDVIYIDPPYNTGNKDFKYNDKIVNKNDLFSHSKWLSFMERRLRIAKKLLSAEGVILVSIDEHEQAQLKILMDEIFGEENFIESIVWNKKSSAKGVPPKNMMVGVHEYILAFQSGSKFKFVGEKRDKRDFKNPDNDPRGLWRESNIKSTIKPIEEAFTITDPNTGREYHNTWAFAKKSLEKMIEEDRILWKDTLPKQKEFLNNMRNENKAIKSNWGTFDNQKTTMFLKKLLPGIQFNNPKPLELMKYLIEVTADKDALIFDFFAGSGTTGQAVIELNQEDGGNRKFILATNNENNIAREITYERMKRVSSGTDKYEAHPMNLKYFKTDFLDKQTDDLENSLLANVKTLIELKHGIDLNNSDVAVVTKRSDIKTLDIPSLSTIYMRSQTHKMLDREQLAQLKDIEIIDIPETFFPMEMKEAGL